jgi:hypothetical protein
LLVDLGIVFEEGEHDFGEGFVVFDAGGVGGVFLGVLVGGVGGDFGGDVVFEALDDAVAVIEDGAEVVVEGFYDDAEAVEFGFAFATAAFDGDGTDFGARVGVLFLPADLAYL